MQRHKISLVLLLGDGSDGSTITPVQSQSQLSYYGLSLSSAMPLLSTLPCMPGALLSASGVRTALHGGSLLLAEPVPAARCHELLEAPCGRTRAVHQGYACEVAR